VNLDRLRETARQLSDEQLVEALYRDQVTGLLNRRAFGQSRSQMLAVLDLDSLKWVNDNHGHGAGDALLQALAREIVAAFGAHRCYRLGGDEFAVRADSALDLLRVLRAVRLRFPGFSFGIGRDLPAADEALRFEKAQRERVGLRAARGQRPTMLCAAVSLQLVDERSHDPRDHSLS
jgi:GGDEF domain-containing protein